MLLTFQWMIPDLASPSRPGVSPRDRHKRITNILGMRDLEVSSVDAGECGPASTQRRQSDEAYAAISRAIVRCDLAPGLTVSEAELAARLHLKTAATRAAVDRLSVVGLLRPIHRRGYVVKPITLRDVNDLFELRAIIEVGVVRLAAGTSMRSASGGSSACAPRNISPAIATARRAFSRPYRVPPGRGSGHWQ